MNQTEQQIENYQELVGFETSHSFERHVTLAVLELAESLKQNFLDNDTKVNYATHVFAKMLDELADMLERSQLLN
ncbi:MAG: hypothetical protein HQM12_21215 [SAR324 cluster bacterium]|nr:hypothetical protein [SAR324 cluster bacterium]MBF0349651.1 hypothetical protein [SAR324 cluster bacterium]